MVKVYAMKLIFGESCDGCSIGPRRDGLVYIEFYDAWGGYDIPDLLGLSEAYPEVPEGLLVHDWLPVPTRITFLLLNPFMPVAVKTAWQFWWYPSNESNK